VSELDFDLPLPDFGPACECDQTTHICPKHDEADRAAVARVLARRYCEYCGATSYRGVFSNGSNGHATDCPRHIFGQ
jgi:hypothetical protein